MASSADEVNENGDLESKLTRTILNLEEIDTNLFRGSHLWKPIGGRAVFGGQVAGQALVAASRTRTSGDYHIHSLHCYFIRPGNPDWPILYHVNRSRDGDSFASRQVSAVQQGDTILTMLVSYHKPEPAPFVFQSPMPQCAPPSALRSYDDILRDYLASEELPETQRRQITRFLAQEIPIDVRPVDPAVYLRQVEQAPPRLLVWMRAKGHVGDDHNINRCVACYMSDWALLRTATLPYPRFRPSMMASLDHSMWFHSHFRTDEWMLYECDSPISVGARSLALARLWKQDGTLAVSVAQEGVIRGTMAQAKL